MRSDHVFTRRRLLSAATATAAGGVFGAAVWPAATAAPATLLGALDKGGPWLNTPGGSEDLAGKVVLVNFLTYSCINSLRPLPYVRTWAEKYGDRGLAVVGVHTPEFAFERDLANVRQALRDLNIRFPVVQDNEYDVWQAYANQAWPAFYVLDAQGRVRHRRVGEGDYDQTERVLQRLLTEARGAPVTDRIIPIVGQGPQAAPDWANLKSPETYVGYRQATSFSGTGGLSRDRTRPYQAPEQLPLNTWALDGVWRVGEEFGTLAEGHGAIAHRFRARDLNLVLAPPADGRPVHFRVRLDGQAPGAHHGFDIDAAGRGKVDAPRMYQLVRQAGSVGDRTFKIEFEGPGAKAYAFTFG